MFGRKQGDGPADDSAFWKQRGWIFSAVFLATVLLAAGVSYLANSGSGEANAATGDRKARSGPLSTDDSKGRKRAPGERPEGCRTEDDQGKDTARPTSAPKDVAWKELAGTMVPTSPSAGPTQFSGPVWWCYARTPMGAVMAAHGILTHMSTADWRTVAEQQIVADEGREKFINQRATRPQSDVESQSPGVPSGFSVPSYSKNAAEVHLLIKSPGGSLTSTTVSMRWSGGDWKVEPHSNGALFTPSSTAMSSGGFIKWGAA
ncbi:hypothetical protein ITI46_30565 [Streptomyces oryzae]|uniref:DUF8175 domain-containing protein n=1 Tax=Streptomyces oryzae TaxID=1434886 RepID=A0ABS3XKM4_9ACTN|nr:hypothetical protein [Streptomyces oryzae]MBO8195957.1 hypothetical protein [Streptomyces oryzae]